jgi:peptide/nickel transport system permease protein
LTEQPQVVNVKSYRGTWRQTIHDFVFSFKGMFGIVVIMLFVILPYLRPYLTPFAPLRYGVGVRDQAPTAAHIMGTTNLGQDVFSQWLVGGIVSVEVGVLTGFFTTILVILIGIPAGYYRRSFGQVLLLFTDVFLVIPVFPLIILLAVYLGPSLYNQILVLTLLTWPFAARIVAAQVLSLRERVFVESGIAAGSSDLRIMFGEILPNMWPLILSNGVLIIVFASLFQAAIAFLGLGNEQLVSWGNMLFNAESVGAVSSGEWWWVVPPGLGITVLALAFSLLVLQIDKVFTERSKAI